MVLRNEAGRLVPVACACSAHNGGYRHSWKAINVVDRGGNDIPTSARERAQDSPWAGQQTGA